MKIGVISDTHHNLKVIDTIIDKHNDVDFWLHAGDNIDDADYLALVSDKPVKAVIGNTDWPSNRDYDLFFNIGGHKIFLTHGDRYNVNQDYNLILAKAKEMNCDIVVFGHTHKGIILKENNITLINPGSASKPRDGLLPSFMIIELEQSTFTFDIKRFFIDK